MRGAMYERMKRYADSEIAFRKVLAMNAENHGALNYLGYMLADRNMRLDEAYEMTTKRSNSSRQRRLPGQPQAGSISGREAGRGGNRAGAGGREGWKGSHGP
jgi:hypothetical protein